MSMHRGAEILLGIAAAGYNSSTPTPISNPTVGAPTGTPLQKVQAAAGADTITVAYTVVINTSNGLSDTFTCAQTTSGRSIVADSAGDIISYPS